MVGKENLEAAAQTIEIIKGLQKMGYSDSEIRSFYRMTGEMFAASNLANEESNDSKELINKLIDIVDELNDKVERLEFMEKDS